MSHSIRSDEGNHLHPATTSVSNRQLFNIKAHGLHHAGILIRVDLPPSIALREPTIQDRKPYFREREDLQLFSTEQYVT